MSSMDGKNTYLHLLLALFVLFLVSACSSTTVPGSSQNFASGSQGIDARFENVPPNVYYYPQGGIAGNEFEVSVEVRNRGASWSRGGIFLSGYDPNLIAFDGIPIGSGLQGGCGFSFQNIAQGEFGGIFSCDDLAVGLTSFGDYFVDVPSVQAFASRLGWDTGGLDFSVRAQETYGQQFFSVSFHNQNFDREYWGHGRLFTALFSGIEFHLGREYVLPGRSFEYPDGGVEYFNFRGNIRPEGWAPGLDEVRQPLLMTNCYFYTTYASPMVCIDTDPYTQREKVCRPNQISFDSSQGAPVAITSVEQEAGGGQSTFRINIANVGRGEVYDPGEMFKCSPYVGDRVRPDDKNVVYVGDIRIGNQRLTNCVPEGVVRLQNGRGTITCTYPYQYAAANSAYETPLNIELWYGYSETERRDIMIKRIA